MRIIFNLINVGMGDQGGSLTIIRSANTLHKLGHDVTIIDSGKNQHTWTPLHAKHIIIKQESDIPLADVVIATGYKSFDSTIKLHSRHGLKVAYIRGWETWQMNEQQIVSHVLNNDLVKIVNSIGLQRKLKSYGYDSYIIRPGNDIEDYPYKERTFRHIPKQITIGGLYHEKHKTKNCHLIFEIFDKLKKEYNVKLIMYGTPKNIPITNCEYYSLPDLRTKNKLYGNVDIWLATSTLEGLHIVPAEAALCGCVIVGNNGELAGTEDYLINDETGLVCDLTADSYISAIKKLTNNVGAMRRLSIAGREKIIFFGNREVNMQKMIQLFEDLRK